MKSQSPWIFSPEITGKCHRNHQLFAGWIPFVWPMTHGQGRPGHLRGRRRRFTWRAQRSVVADFTRKTIGKLLENHGKMRLTWKNDETCWFLWDLTKFYGMSPGKWWFPTGFEQDKRVIWSELSKKIGDFFGWFDGIWPTRMGYEHVDQQGWDMSMQPRTSGKR